MRKQVSELEGPALDYAVAKAVGHSVTYGQWGPDHYGAIIPQPVHLFPDQTVPFKPSTDWRKGGPLIDEYNIEIMRAGHDVWAKVAGLRDAACDGRTALEATCRAVVKHMLGDTVDIPEALCP